MMASQFVANGQMKARVFQQDNRRPTADTRNWDSIVSRQQPRALPAYSASAQSAVPGMSLMTRTSLGI